MSDGEGKIKIRAFDNGEVWEGEVPSEDWFFPTWSYKHTLTAGWDAPWDNDSLGAEIEARFRLTEKSGFAAWQPVGPYSVHPDASWGFFIEQVNAQWSIHWISPGTPWEGLDGGGSHETHMSWSMGDWNDDFNLEGTIGMVPLSIIQGSGWYHVKGIYFTGGEGVEKPCGMKVWSEDDAEPEYSYIYHSQQGVGDGSELNLHWSVQSFNVDNSSRWGVEVDWIKTRRACYPTETAASGDIIGPFAFAAVEDGYEPANGIPMIDTRQVWFDGVPAVKTTHYNVFSGRIIPTATLASGTQVLARYVAY